LIHPFLWQNGVMTDLGLLPGFAVGTAQAINSAGEVVGTMNTRGFPTTQHAFVYRAGVLSDLNTLIYGNPGFTLSDARGIDDAGEIIVNGTVNFVDHAYLLKPHTATAIPAAPAGLTATVGIGWVTLSWQPSAEALRYNVKRATTSGGPYTTIGVTPSGPTFTDRSVTSGQTYFYVVSGVNALGESANSSPVRAVPR
jgi:probable HAF family extracellular repeat protein